jgi:hypothetical protein
MRFLTSDNSSPDSTLQKWSSFEYVAEMADIRYSVLKVLKKLGLAVTLTQCCGSELIFFGFGFGSTNYFFRIRIRIRIRILRLIF